MKNIIPLLAYARESGAFMKQRLILFFVINFDFSNHYFSIVSHHNHNAIWSGRFTHKS
jgi:hypothetical protein